MLRILNKNNKRAFAILFLLIGLSVFFALIGQKAGATGTITGRVYEDYNSNGSYDTTDTTTAIDSGVSGVTVTAYDSTGTNRGSTTSGANGLYTLNATGTGPYRIEFTNIPAGYSPSEIGTNNATTVRILADGVSPNIDFGIVRPDNYCQTNPDVITNVFAVGNGNFSAFARFPYNYSQELDGRLNSIDPTAWTAPPSRTALLNPVGIGTINEVGSTLGVSFNKFNNRFYASSYLKRGARFGSLSSESTGAIYSVANPSTSAPTVSLFVDLNTVFGAGTAGANPHPAASTPDWTVDTASIAEIGKRGLGAIKISQDGTRLYAVNLADRQLYVIPTTGALNSTTITRFPIPTTGLATSSGNCNAADVRPFAVGKDRSGQIYVGAVCSAESETSDVKLHAFVWSFNGATFTLVANNALTFIRTAGPGDIVTWQRWANTTGVLNRASPMLTDIEFDGNDMLLGLRDRYGDQIVLPDFYRGYGDLMRVCNNSGTFTFESNGTCGGVTTPVPAGGNANSGNGGREYYNDLNGDAREEGGVGGLIQVPGYNHVVTSFYDSVAFNSAGTRVTNFYTTGIQRYNNTTGVITGAYDVYLDADPGNFGKAGGVGDTDVFCRTAPLQIGNRVWNDSDSDGIQDSNENGILNVSVQLWGDTNADGSIDTQIGTATTNAAGQYVFGGTGNTNLSTYACGMAPATATAQVSASSDDAFQNTGGTMDPLTNTELRMGGVVGASGVRFTSLSIPQGATITNAYIQFTADDTPSTTGAPTVTIQGEAANNATTFTTANNNITGRTGTTATVSWSIPAWNTNSEIGANQRTPAITSIVQEIVNRPGWASGNAMVFRTTGGGGTTRRDAETFDDVSGSAAQLVIEYTANATCQYAIDPNTNYEIRIPATNFNAGQALNALVPTLVDADGTANGDSRDSDGLVTSGSQVMRALTTGSVGQNNHTYDFGFKSAATGYSVGNRVWFDTNNDGRVNAGELGISSVSVSIFADANSDGQPDTPGTPVATLTTDSNGYYRFDNLAAGTYVVRINPAAFTNGAVLAGYQNTTGNITGDVDSDLTNAGENGVNPTGAANTVQANGILSNTITLGPGSVEPLSESDLSATGQGTLDNQGDMTVDFGFYCLSLSGTLWNDTGAGPFNNNGQLDAGETVIPTIRVRLYDSTGVEIPVGRDGILGTADDGLGGTVSDASGNYNFRCLPPGQYRVVVGGVNAVSSTPTSTTPDDNINNDDNGLPGTGQFNGLTISNLVTLTPASVGAQSNNTVTNATGSTANPTVDFGFITAPTYVKLDGFDVYLDGNETVVKWSTAAESDNLGFNVYREVGGRRELINRAMIAGSSLRTNANLVATGDNYNWTDNSPKAGAVYYLEDIDMKGNSTLHGPVSPKIKFSASSLFKTNPVLITDLNKNDNFAKEQEFVGKDIVKQSETPKLKSESGNQQKGIARRGGVKISVNHDAWYRVSAEQLQAAGFDLNSNRELWQLFANGEEVPLKLNSDSSIEFFGTGNDKVTTDTKIYYLIEGQRNGQRLGAVDGGNSDGNNEARNFVTTTVRNDRQIYFSSILNGEETNYFGALVFGAQQTLQSLTVHDLDTEGQITLRVKLQSITAGNHLVTLRLNNLDLGTVSLTNLENKTFEYNLPINSIAAGVNQVRLQSVGAGNDLSLVDSISLTYPRRYNAVDGKLRFTVPAGQGVRVGGFADTNVNIFEIRNGRVERQVLTDVEKDNGNPEISLSQVSYDRELLAIEQTQTESPARVEENTPSNLQHPRNEADFVIITNGDLREGAESLATVRQSQGLKTKVVLVDDIYDEFGFGEHSPEAIKEFLRLALSEWQIKPRYVLLFGDSSYDPRNFSGQTNRDIVPTKLVDTAFQETGSDIWLVDFNNDGIEDVALGRLPVVNAAEANVVLSKLAQYETQISRQKSSLMISDSNFQNYNDILQTELPNDVQVSRIERSSLTDGEMHDQIVSRLNTGPMVVTYTGHGAPGLWASADVFKTADVANINNEKLSIYLMMTCLNGYTISPFSDSMTEALFKKDGGGAIAVWASSGSTYPDKQLEMSRTLTRNMFSQNTVRLGDLIRLTKQSTTDLDVRKTWQLIGDPTIFVK